MREPGLRALLLVWATLLALLAATASVALLPWMWLHPALNFAIAIAKSLLIGIFFMHLKSAGLLSRLIAIGGFLWLGILLVLSFADFWTRPLVPLQ